MYPLSFASKVLSTWLPSTMFYIFSCRLQVDQHKRFFGQNLSIHLSSAMLMSRAQQELLTYKEYMEFNKGFNGNPNKLEVVRSFVPPSRYKANRSTARAW